MRSSADKARLIRRFINAAKRGDFGRMDIHIPPPTVNRGDDVSMTSEEMVNEILAMWQPEPFMFEIGDSDEDFRQELEAWWARRISELQDWIYRQPERNFEALEDLIGKPLTSSQIDSVNANWPDAEFSEQDWEDELGTVLSIWLTTYPQLSVRLPDDFTLPQHSHPWSIVESRSDRTFPKRPST